MDNSKAFRIAHRITRRTVRAGDDYRVTFGKALNLIKKRLVIRALLMAKELEASHYASATAWKQNARESFAEGMEAHGDYCLSRARMYISLMQEVIEHRLHLVKKHKLWGILKNEKKFAVPGGR